MRCSRSRSAPSSPTGPTTRWTRASGRPTASTSTAASWPASERGPRSHHARTHATTPPEPTPESPSDVGVPERVPELPQIEGARTLGNDARERLHADGFDDAQIDAWAETFIAERSSGTVDEFVAWIARRERTG